MKPPKLEWRETKRAYLLGLTLTIIDLVVGLVALLWGGVGKAAQALFHPTVWTAVGVCCWVLWRKRPASLDSDVAVEAFSERARGFAFWGLVLTLSIYVPGCVWYYSQQIHVITATPEGKVGIVLAEFGEGPEFRRSERGTEIRDALDHALQVRLAEIGLGERVFVQSVGIVSDESAAAAEAERAGASIVVWGWYPADGEGLVPSILIRSGQQVRDLLTRFEREPLAPLLGIDEILPDGGVLMVGGSLADRTAVVAAFVTSVVHMSDSEYSEATRDLTEAITLSESIGAREPYVSTLYALRGVAFAALGRAEEAESDFDRALEIEPCDVTALVGIGNARYSQGEMYAAQDAYGRAEDCDALSVRAKIGLGNAWFYVGRGQEAALKIEEAVEIDSSCTVAHYNLGIIYWRLGNIPASIEALERCVGECSSEPELLADATSLLASIQSGGGLPAPSGSSIEQGASVPGEGPRLPTPTHAAPSLAMPAYDFRPVVLPAARESCEAVYVSGWVVGAGGEALNGVTIRLRTRGVVMYEVSGDSQRPAGEWMFVPLDEEAYHEPATFVLDVVRSETEPLPLSDSVQIRFTDCAVAGEFTGLTFQYAW